MMFNGSYFQVNLHSLDYFFFSCKIILVKQVKLRHLNPTAEKEKGNLSLYSDKQRSYLVNFSSFHNISVFNACGKSVVELTFELHISKGWQLS